MAATVANALRHVHRAALAGQRTIAPDVVEYTFRLAPEDAPLTWRAGQFISLHCGAHLRSYSLASLPNGESFVLLVKRVVGGGASDWFRQIGIGTEVCFTGPMGFFTLELAHPGDLLFAATGTGIAALLPMIEEALQRSETGHIHLFWGLRSDPYWIGELERLAHRRFSSTIFLSQPKGDWAGARGRITPAVLGFLPSLDRPTFYLCGNGAMIRELKQELIQRGIDRKRQIRCEAFFG